MSRTLICFAPGGEDVFSVDIDETKLVTHLKEVIKEKNPHALANVDAAALTLYRAEIDESDDGEFFMKELNRLSAHLNECKPLFGWLKLSKYFREEPPAGKIYIILVESPKGESIYCGRCPYG